MKKVLLVVAIFALGAAAGFSAGRWTSNRDLNAMVLAGELETISLCANGLNSLDAQPVRTVRLLDYRLRSAVKNATQQSGASAAIETAIPNLMEGLNRAKRYAERKGDTKLAADIAQLQVAVAQPRS